MKSFYLRAFLLSFLYFTIQFSSFSQINSIQIDGLDDNITIPTSINPLLNANTITVEAMVKPLSGINYSGMMVVGQTHTGGDLQFAIYFIGLPGSGQMSAGFYNNATGWTEAVSTIPCGDKWSHIAATYDRSNILLYVDGILVASTPATAPMPLVPANNWRVGYRWDATSGAPFVLNGELDEVRIWNVARSSGQIAANKAIPLIGNEPGLVTYYDFNQGIAGGNNTGISQVLDKTSNAINASMPNFAKTGLTSNFVSSTAFAAPAPAPEINLQGNSNTIFKGDITPSLTDFTDFGNVSISSGAFTRTFTIQNTGNAVLNLTGNPRVTVSGVGFSIQLDASPVLGVFSSNNFIVAFDPSIAGLATGTITIANDDCDENSYTFSIQGTGISDPGEALGFDGSNEAVTILDNNTLDITTQYTLETKVNFNSYGYSTLVSKFDDDGNNRGWMLNMGEVGGNTICVTHDQFGNWSNHIQWNTGFVPSLGIWYHFAVTFDASLPSNNIKFYVDGALIAQGNWAFPVFANNANVYLGGYDSPGNGVNGGANSRYFNGILDETLE